MATELKPFFDRFYQARPLTPLHAIDLEMPAFFVAGSYATYTMPLEQSRVEAESGPLKEVRSEISIQVKKWEPGYTDHGGSRPWRSVGSCGERHDLEVPPHPPAGAIRALPELAELLSLARA